MSSSALPQNTRTTRVPQNILSSRGNIPIKHSRNHHTSMNGDHHYDRDFCSNDNPEESHPFQKTNLSQGTKPCTSHPVPGGVEDLAAAHSIGTPRHENNRSSTQSNTTIITTSSTRRSRSSHIITPSSPDPTRSRHVPRGPVPRVHPSTSHAIRSSMSQGHQKSLGHSKPIPNASMGGVETGSEIGLGGTAGVGTDTMRAGTGQLGYAPSPLQNIKSEQDHPTMRSPRDNKPPQDSAPIRRLASPPHRISNTPPISSNDDVRPCSSLGLGSLQFEVSAAAGCSKPEQGNRDSYKAVEMKVRPTVRPLPALPGETGSASKSSTEQVEELYPSSSLTTFSNSLTSPHKMDATELHSTNKFGIASRAATITSRKLATFNAQTTQLRCTPQRTMTNDRDQSDDDTPTPTVPFPTPRRSMTIGVPSLSRDTKPPPLSIPPLNRCLSLKGFTQGTARLSPSVIIRPPPLPLVNLPVLVVSSTTGSEGCERGDARRRSRLMMSMPALPLQGSGRATRGHEEVDDLEDDDEDDDEVDEVNEPASGQSSASSSSRIETPRSSFDSETSLDEADGDDFTKKQSTLNHSSHTLSSTSSYETARAEPSPSFWESHRWDVDQPAKPGSKATTSSSKVPRQLPQVDLTAGGIDYDSSTDHIRVEKGKAKQELRGKEGLIGDFVFPLTKEAVLSNSKCRGDRGVDGLKVVATPDDVKVARSYGSERLVLERVGSGGSAGRARLNSNDPNPSGAKNGTLPRHPLPLEPLRAAGSSTLPVKGTILGSPHPGDRAMRSNSRLMSISTTPLGSPQLEEPRSLGIGPHNDMYRRASRSLIDVHAIEMKGRVERMVRDQEEEDERKRSSRILKVGRKGNEGAVSQDKGKQPEAEECSVWHSETLNAEDGTPTSVIHAEKTTAVDNGEKTDNTQESASHPLRRRRSVPTTGPPSYSALFTGLPPGLAMDLKVQPREDEGKENLPPYTNDIFLKAVMPRKMEFTSPGVQAKDRKWRQVLCVLDGTALRVYKCPPRTGGVSAWWDNKIGVGDPLTDSVASPSGARSTVRNSAASGGALARETELARAKKNGDASQPHLQINTPADKSQQLRSYSPLPKPQRQIHQERQSSVSQGVTKSALIFAVQLLKPGATRHSRSSSEVSRVSGPLPSSSRSRRASSSSPRESTSGRMTPTTQTENDRSGSVLSHWSSQSRPLSPASGERSDNKKRGGENDLIRAYTMQHAESGLGKDYTKRQHVIRVRLEGEQFLLQAKDVDGVIAWIEGLQCAANVALDLDVRPMPSGPLIPRRRRRRRAPVAAE